MQRTPLERLQRKSSTSDAGCWLWDGWTEDGYGRFMVDREIVQVHRRAYEFFIGPIPDGLVLDHLCHVAPCAGGASCEHRRCWNPDHMEPVTTGENVLRGDHGENRRTHCKYRHEMTPENTRITAEGRRQCIECGRRRSRESYHRSVS